MCDPGIPLPRMEVTFSMARLNKLEGECKQYMAAVQTMYNQLQEQREKEVGFSFDYFNELRSSFCCVCGRLRNYFGAQVKSCSLSEKVYVKEVP